MFLLLAIVSQKFLLELTIPSSLCPITSLRLQIGIPLLHLALGLPPSIGGQIPSVYNLQYFLLLWSWSCLSERRQIRISSVFGECHRFPCFLVLVLETSPFESLLEEGFSNAIRKPYRLSDPCFANVEKMALYHMDENWFYAVATRSKDKIITSIGLEGEDHFVQHKKSRRKINVHCHQ